MGKHWRRASLKRATVPAYSGGLRAALGAFRLKKGGLSTRAAPPDGSCAPHRPSRSRACAARMPTPSKRLALLAVTTGHGISMGLLVVLGLLFKRQHPTLVLHQLLSFGSGECCPLGGPPVPDSSSDGDLRVLPHRQAAPARQHTGVARRREPGYRRFPAKRPAPPSPIAIARPAVLTTRA